MIFIGIYKLVILKLLCFCFQNATSELDQRSVEPSILSVIENSNKMPGENSNPVVILLTVFAVPIKCHKLGT